MYKNKNIIHKLIDNGALCLKYIGFLKYYIFDRATYLSQVPRKNNVKNETGCIAVFSFFLELYNHKRARSYVFPVEIYSSPSHFVQHGFCSGSGKMV